MWNPDHLLGEVDLFVDNPIDFEDLWRRSIVVDVGRIPARIASIPDLIALKRIAGRPEDRLDIEALEAIMDHGRRDDG